MMFYNKKNLFLFLIIFISSILCKEKQKISDEQKLLFNNHKNKLSQLKKDFLYKKDTIQKEYDRLLPLYNSLQKEYNLKIDSLDIEIQNKITNFNNVQDPKMVKFIQIIDATKNNQLNLIQNRKNYYKNEFIKLDSTINLLFDIILLYEQNSFDENNIITSLDAEILALTKIISNAKKTVSNYEKGISSNKLNSCIISLIDADRYIYEQNYLEAIKVCNNAIQKFPDYSGAYEKLGSAHYLNNNFEEALKNWTIALSMNPENSNLNKFLDDIKNTR